MISWIQKYFQKHFFLVFLIVLIAIALPTVAIYSQSFCIGRNGRQVLKKPFFGYNLAKAEDVSRIMRDGSISAQLKGAFLVSSEQIQQYALARIAGLSLADKLHLPQPDAKEVSVYVANLPVFKNTEGKFDQTAYSRFADSLKNNPEFTTADASRVLQSDTYLNTLGKITGGPGYVQPSDITTQLICTDSTWTINVATLDFSAFTPTLNPSKNTLKKFYERNSFRYEIPTSPKISLVQFKAVDFVSPSTPTEDQLRAFYNTNPNRFSPHNEANKKSADVRLDAKKDVATKPDNFQEARTQVEAALRYDLAMNSAQKAANNLAVALYDRKTTANSADLTAFLATHNHPAKSIGMVNPETPPTAYTWLANYADEISRLSKDHFFSDPVANSDGFAILLWNETVSAYIPPLADIRDKVEADYKDNEKRKLFVKKGKKLHTKLETALKAGTTFAKAAADQKLEVKDFANFAFRQPPQGIPYQALNVLQKLEASNLSDMVASNDKGYFVYVVQKKLPDLSPSNPQYAKTRHQLMQRSAAANQSALLNSMVEIELENRAQIRLPDKGSRGLPPIPGKGRSAYSTLSRRPAGYILGANRIIDSHTAGRLHFGR